MIHFQVEMQDLTEIESELGMLKDKSKMVLKTAINNVAKQTVVYLVDEANRQYIINKKVNVRKTLDVKKATTSTLTAIVKSTGRTTELYDFRVSPRAYAPRNRPPAGHTGNVKRSNSPGALYLKPGGSDQYKAFVVKFKSGHISVAQRVPGKSAKNGKEAIKNLRSTSVPKMLGYEKGVWGAVKPKMDDLLVTEIQKQIQRFLG